MTPSGIETVNFRLVAHVSSNCTSSSVPLQLNVLVFLLVAAGKSDAISINLGSATPYEYDHLWTDGLSLSDAVASFPRRSFGIRNIAVVLTECIFVLGVVQAINRGYSPKQYHVTICAVCTDCVLSEVRTISLDFI
jgi:hypothetical protein